MCTNFGIKRIVKSATTIEMVKNPIKLPLLKASDSSRSRDHDRRIKSEIYAVKEMSSVKMNQISEKTRSKCLLLVQDFFDCR